MNWVQNELAESIYVLSAHITPSPPHPAAVLNAGVFPSAQILTVLSHLAAFMLVSFAAWADIARRYVTTARVTTRLHPGHNYQIIQRECSPLRWSAVHTVSAASRGPSWFVMGSGAFLEFCKEFLVLHYSTHPPHPNQYFSILSTS